MARVVHIRQGKNLGLITQRIQVCLKSLDSYCFRSCVNKKICYEWSEYEAEG